MKFLRAATGVLLLGSLSLAAQAGLLEDEEARKAILDLRQRVEAVRLSSEQSSGRVDQDFGVLRKSLLDLQSQLDQMRSEVAGLRGLNEQLARDLSAVQQQQKNAAQSFDDRFRQFEPQKISVDGRDFTVERPEKQDFEAALAVFRRGEFAASQTAFSDFLKRYPQSGYGPSVLFWLGNAQYATRNYKDAMANFRALIARDPEHVRAPEAVLSIANCQTELKDARGAKKTLEDLLKAYPGSEAASAAKERLARLK
jgi:tol-pal system protein YbgF